jgi:hypothetical protein
LDLANTAATIGNTAEPWDVTLTSEASPSSLRSSPSARLDGSFGAWRLAMRPARRLLLAMLAMQQAVRRSASGGRTRRATCRLVDPHLARQCERRRRPVDEPLEVRGLRGGEYSVPHIGDLVGQAGVDARPA